MSIARFFRNLSSFKELVTLTKTKGGQLVNYEIIGIVKLDVDQYKTLCNDFQKGCPFLIPYTESSRIVNGVWNCILIVCNSCPGILVMTNGYQYPRFVAVYS